MERRIGRNLLGQIDWITVGLFFLLVILGWLNIYAAVYDPDPVTHKSIFSLSINSGKQLMWIGLSLLIILFIILMDFKLYDTLAYVIYGASIASLVGVLLFGSEIYGSKSWFKIGGFTIQPAEFAKFATALAVAKFLDEHGKKTNQIQHFIIPLIIIAIPALLILKQGDAGSAMVFASFLIVFYREGLPQYIMVIGIWAVTMFVLTLVFQDKYFLELLLGIGVVGILTILVGDKKWKRIMAVLAITGLSVGMVWGTDYFVNKVLAEHQRARVKLLVNPELSKEEKRGIGYQTVQSKIAIGAGGLLGKGFLEGTQTKFDYVPKQSTDFIFCTIGEEHGWIGSLVVIGLFIAFLNRLIILSERQKSRFSRVYGYCVMVIIFFHFTINIGMTIGLFPVIGIPLPFFSYGGSSLWAFTILLFIMVKLDAHRKQLMVKF
jgi:rod shape determining protein RodA